MSGVSVLPHKSADDSVIDVHVDTNILTGHPCPMHPSYLPSDIFRYSSAWHIKIVTLSNLLSTYESQEFAFTILHFSNLYPIVFSPSHDIGETHALHETLCEYRDVRVRFNGTVHSGLIVLSFS